MSYSADKSRVLDTTSFLLTRTIWIMPLVTFCDSWCNIFKFGDCINLVEIVLWYLFFVVVDISDKWRFYKITSSRERFE